VGTFDDYFASLSDGSVFGEPVSASSTLHLALNPKEANNPKVPRARSRSCPLPRQDGVVAVGEIGFDDQTAEEEKSISPPARARWKVRPARLGPRPTGTRARNRTKPGARSVRRDPRRRVLIDHNNEETFAPVLATRLLGRATSIYPETKDGRGEDGASSRNTEPTASSSTAPQTGA